MPNLLGVSATPTSGHLLTEVDFFQVCLVRFSSKLPEGKNQAPLYHHPPPTPGSLALCLTQQRGCSTQVG